MLSATPRSLPDTARHQRISQVVEAHLDPVAGAAFWIDRARERGIDRRDIRSFDELALLGPLTQADLLSRPLQDFVPLRFHRLLHRFVLGQTGGTTGPGVWTTYLPSEFHEAFVSPFVLAAQHVGFPRRVPWLYIGPTGPHIIGTAMRHLARRLKSPQPFCVDFDPRWAKKLPEGSFAQQRYLSHVIEQAMQVLEREPVGVLFTTPPVLGPLARRMSERHRQRIGGVHYGGIALSPELLQEFQERWFPRAVHLSGYGNTLFGCALELASTAGRQLDYFPLGDRLRFEVVDDVGRPLPSGRGRVRFTRLDRSVLILQMLERDEAQLVPPPRGAPPGFGPGLRNPAPSLRHEPQQSIGIY